MAYPLMHKGRLNWAAPRVENIQEEVLKALKKARFWDQAVSGARIAITAGSRGIADIVPVLKTIAAYLKEKGLQPFLLAAMGSHGGGTAEGQRKVLVGLGITEEAIGVPVMTNAKAVKLGYLASGLPVFINSLALECDGILVVNRVKPHTSFRGPVESGLMKMLAIGLGNPQGAATIHQFGPSGLRRYIPEVGSFIIDKMPVLYGLAILENAYEQTAKIVGVEPEAFFATEQELLQEARRLMPKLPFNDIDVLVVKEMGKCFSGTGMDTNIIGRLRIHGETEPEEPRIKRIAVLDLAPGSKGNALGIGLADFTTDRLLAKVDWEATYLNVISTTFVQRAMIPMHFPTDQETVDKALMSLGAIKPEDARLLVINNTLELTEMAFSQALLREARDCAHLQIVGSGEELAFSDKGLNI